MGSLNTKMKNPATKKAGTSPIKAKKKANTVTHEGADATKLKAKSELFLTAVTTFAGEDTFYEKGSDRIDRITKLVHKVTNSDPEWVEEFAAWLRGPDANIRTASLIIAAEYVAAGGPNGRKIIDSVCQRADEPGEILAYWINNHNTLTGFPQKSPKIPQSIRKGLGDAVRRLYTEYSAMKYFGGDKQVSMASVLNLIHPTPKDEAQAKVFKYIIDRSYGNDLDLSGLPMLTANHEVRGMSPEQFESALSPELLKEAGMTWEQVGGKLPNGWTAKAWGSMIPSMGYMALLRNLSNFEKARIDAADKKKVRDILSDPDRVASSRQLPFRFLTAHKNTNSSAFSSAIEDALDLSVKNVPRFGGKTLILVDVSGSMTRPVGGRNNYYTPRENQTSMSEVGALFGVALALKGEDVDLVAFGTDSRRIDLAKGSGVLAGISKIRRAGVGHGTNTASAIRKHFNGHDRVVVFTDIQSHENLRGSARDAFIHYFDLSGYGRGTDDLRDPGRFMYGGFTDSTFKMMTMIENGSTASWPWEF